MCPYHRPASAVFSALLLCLAAGCDSSQQSASPKGTDLEQALSAVEGRYTLRREQGKYSYSEKARLEEILSAQPREAVVAKLVECLDNPSPSRSTLEGKPVALGIICYEALTQMVYYEPTAPNGDVAADWAGFLSPQASPEQMRAAKQAWIKVLESKAFIYL